MKDNSKKGKVDINEIILAIDVLRSDKFYGGGKYIEIAKGKNEIASNWKGLKKKIKRLIKA